MRQDDVFKFSVGDRIVDVDRMKWGVGQVVEDRTTRCASTSGQRLCIEFERRGRVTVLTELGVHRLSVRRLRADCELQRLEERVRGVSSVSGACVASTVRPLVANGGAPATPAAHTVVSVPAPIGRRGDRHRRLARIGRVVHLLGRPPVRTRERFAEAGTQRRLG